ncbi:unnamed protein product [Oppiella nova]|uniref:Rhodanese domain-containing protein n=1 Tax=Oppiella nova TaxID=334625 RepID=A0A7R9LFQ5_9ACAR|nr:unnamed protein product [Oppiella nova]CAG2163218.1 unnamed protein product [Oppiella nova]
MSMPVDNKKSIIDYLSSVPKALCIEDIGDLETIMSMPVDNKKSIIDYLSSVPKALCIEDIGDLFYLVEQHYVSRTPHTIKNLQSLLFQASEPVECEPQITDLSHMLCLPVPVTDLLPNASAINSVRYFCVDCRPAEQYNSGHLSTAFHLDCSLLLEEPSAFNTAVKALLAAQRQAIDEQSVAGGHHLCFMGSGRDEEDQYVHMVVASFLQKHHQFVSLAYGGYECLHRLITTNTDLDRCLIDHNRKQCIACTAAKSPNKSRNGPKSQPSTTGALSADVEHFTSALLDKVANAVKPKMKEMKDKFVDYVTNPNQQQVVRHVSPSDKLGKRYKAFNHGLESDSNDESAQEIDIEKWSKSPEIIGCFKCQEIKDDGHMCPSYLGLSNSHLFVLREMSHNKSLAKIMAKRPLEMIVQITSKRRCPDLITFKYGHTIEGGEPNVVAKDHLLIPKPYDITRLIKQQVIRILDGETSSGSNSSSKASNK